LAAEKLPWTPAEPPPGIARLVGSTPAAPVTTAADPPARQPRAALDRASPPVGRAFVA
jgi:hypothetical protein